MLFGFYLVDSGGDRFGSGSKYESKKGTFNRQSSGFGSSAVPVSF